jgi:hypothetical protein
MNIRTPATLRKPAAPRVPAALRTSALLLLASLSLAGCGESITGPQTPEDVTFNPGLGIDLADFTELPSGIWINTLSEGTGDAIEEGGVTVDYEVRLVDNSVVDSGVLFFEFATGAVIPGFELGVLGMRIGETRRILVPSRLGYGERGFGAIPPNAVLIFTVTLLSIGESG